MADEATTPEVQEALESARRLIRAGVPIFSAEPCPEGCPATGHHGGPGRYHLPKHWEKTVPAEVWLERWRPGHALAAVGGHTVDFLDVDPRNGGDTSLQEIVAAGHMPHIFGRAKTPSGGDHFIIAATGERKSTGFMPGVDLQSGAPDGQGRGFVWIAPTVRPSKDPADAGTLRTYRWDLPPGDLTGELEEWGASARDSTEGIVARVTARRLATKERSAAAPAIDPDDPFMTASSTSGHHPGDRSFTTPEAQDFVRPYLVELQAAPVGMIEERANVAATVLSHFVPAFWSTDQAYRLLLDALSHTAYDPNGPGEWTAEKFRPVLDGRRPPLDNWKARRKPEPAQPPAAMVEAAPGEEALTTLEKLRRKLVTAQDLANSPAPEPLVHDLLDLDTESWMIGAPGSMKSFVALDLAGHIGAGKEWQGLRVERRPVLYLAAEGQRGMVLRTRAWMKVHGDMEGVTFLPYPVKVKSHDGQWEALVELARELKPGMVVIDTQHRVSVGLEENSATDMGVLTEAVSALRRATGACVLVIHHTGRNGGDARGSSALDGAQDTELKVVRGEPRTSLQCKIIQDKQKDMAEGDRSGILLQLQVVDLGVDERTGRKLDSLVVADALDPFVTAQDDVAAQERLVRPWLPSFHQRDRWKRTILNALYDFAPAGVGLTEARVKEILVQEAGLGRKATQFQAAWKAVLELRDPEGAPVVENVGGQRYDLVSLAVLAALEESNGPRGEGGPPPASE
jgi:hypothetical protein